MGYSPTDFSDPGYGSGTTLNDKIWRIFGQDMGRLRNTWNKKETNGKKSQKKNVLLSDEEKKGIHGMGRK